jgi:hypothetical protein
MRQMDRECMDFLRKATPAEVMEKIREGLKELLDLPRTQGGIDPMG